MLPEGAVSPSNMLKRMILSIQRFGLREQGITRRVLEELPPTTVEDQNRFAEIRLELILEDIEGSWARLWPGDKPIAGDKPSAGDKPIANSTADGN